MRLVARLARLLLLPALTLVPACAQDLTPHPASLDSIRSRAASLRVTRDGSQLEVTFVGDYGAESCPAFDLVALRATLDGEALSVVATDAHTTGLHVLGGDLNTPSRRCGNPSAAFTVARLPTAPSSALVLEDGTTRVSMHVDGFFAPLTMALAPSAPATVRPGDDVRLQVEPETVTLEDPSLLFTDPGGSVSLPKVQRDGALLHFTVPSATAPGITHVQLATVTVVATSRCEGIAACVARYYLDEGPSVAVVVAPAP